MRIKLCLALCLTLILCVGHAGQADKPASAADLASVQQQLQAQGQELAIHKHTLQISLDSADKRLADFATLATMQGSHTTWVGNVVALASIFITFLVFIGGFMTFKRAKEEAQTEARDASEKWFGENSKALNEQIAQLEKQAKEAVAAIAIHTSSVEAKADMAHQTIVDSARQVRDVANALMQSQSSFNALPGSPLRPADPDAAKQVRQISEALKAKPEADFTADEYFVRGADLFTNGNFQGALDAFEATLLASGHAPAIDQVKYLFAKAIALGALNRSEEAIQVYEALDARFGQDTSPGVREPVAKGLMNKGFRLGTLGRFEEAIQVYEALDARFGQDASPGVREQVARVLNGLGFTKIMQAKANWADEALRQASLSSAVTVLARALTQCSSETRAMVLGNLGYGLFLAGQTEAARAPTQECLTLGGPKMMAAQRADARLHRVEPQDSAYEALLDELDGSAADPA